MTAQHIYETYLRHLPLGDFLVYGDGPLSMPEPEFTGNRASLAFEEWDRSSSWREILKSAGDMTNENAHEQFLKAHGYQWIGMEHPFHKPCPDWPEPYHPVADLQALFQPDQFSAFQEAIAGLQLGFTPEIRNLSSFLAAISHRFAQYQHFGGRDFRLRFAKLPFDMVSEGEISRMFDKWLISKIKPDAQELARFQSFLLIQVALLCHKSQSRLHLRTGIVQHPVSGYSWTIPEQPLKEMERYFALLYQENCLPKVLWQPSGSDWTNALRFSGQFLDEQKQPLVQVLPDLAFPFSRADFHRWLDQLYAEGRLETSCFPASSARNLAQLERNQWMRQELCIWWAGHPFLSDMPENEVKKWMDNLVKGPF